MNDFSTKLYLDFNTELTNATTISRLALNIFFKKYSAEAKVPAINNHTIYNFIKEGYFGGITEVYKPYGENLKLIDVNSLYPSAALNPLPGLNSTYIESLDSENYLELENLFGFFYAKVKSPSYGANGGAAPSQTYFGLLPVNTPKGLIFPSGSFSGVWSSEELKFAKTHGYSIQVIKGYNFDREISPFINYVTELYQLKSEATGSRKTIFKSLLNNLIGRFGMNINKPITIQVDSTKRDYIASTRVIKAQHHLFNNKFLITYLPEISKEICEEHNLDYNKVLEKENKNNTSLEIKTFKDTSIAVTAMINSYARIFMNKIKLDLYDKKMQIYYMDTDSLVVETKAFDYLNNKEFIGNKLGQFKLEHNIAKAYFISNKTYCFSLNDSDTDIVIKAKGVNKNVLTLNNFVDLYNEKNIQTNRRNTIINYEKASVSIKNTDILLRHDSFTKRVKIYDDERR